MPPRHITERDTVLAAKQTVDKILDMIDGSYQGPWSLVLCEDFLVQGKVCDYRPWIPIWRNTHTGLLATHVECQQLAILRPYLCNVCYRIIRINCGCAILDSDHWPLVVRRLGCGATRQLERRTACL